MHQLLHPQRKIVAVLSALALSTGLLVASASTVEAAVSNVVKPSIAGKAAVGVTLVARKGYWSGIYGSPTSTQYTYQWLADGNPIADATLSAYKVTAAELGQQISVAVTAHKPPLAGVTATSNPTQPVVNGTIRPGAFYVQGNNQVGHTQAVVTEGWDPANVTITIDWYCDGALITSGLSYTPTAAQLGTKTKVVVTGSKFGYNSKSVSYTRNGKVNPSQ